jgi:hypothetical protein
MPNVVRTKVDLVDYLYTLLFSVGYWDESFSFSGACISEWGMDEAKAHKGVRHGGIRGRRTSFI